MLRRTERIRRARRVRREPTVNVIVVPEGETPPELPKQDGVVNVIITFCDMSPGALPTSAMPAREHPNALGDPARPLEARAVDRQAVADA